MLDLACLKVCSGPANATYFCLSRIFLREVEMLRRNVLNTLILFFLLQDNFILRETEGVGS